MVYGAYGTSVIDVNTTHNRLIAGGTGVSFTLLLAQQIISSVISEKRMIDFVWIIRRSENITWVQKELIELKKQANETLGIELFLNIFVTRQGDGAKRLSSSPASASVSGSGAKQINVKKIAHGGGDHGITYCLKDYCPVGRDIVRGFRDECLGKDQVLGSGPPELGKDLRESVALCNDGSKVWRGDTSGGKVTLYWDSREY